jgi:hypothetical protein
MCSIFDQTTDSPHILSDQDIIKTTRIQYIIYILTKGPNCIENQHAYKKWLEFHYTFRRPWRESEGRSRSSPPGRAWVPGPEPTAGAGKQPWPRERQQNEGTKRDMPGGWGECIQAEEGGRGEDDGPPEAQSEDHSGLVLRRGRVAILFYLTFLCDVLGIWEFKKNHILPPFQNICHSIFFYIHSPYYICGHNDFLHNLACVHMHVVI